MKILMINNAYQEFGSTEAVALSEKELLEANGHDVVLYSRDSKELLQFSLKEKLALPFNTVYSARTQREIRQIVRQFQPEVAYVHNFLPLISPSVYHTLGALGVPCVQVIHEFRLFCPNSHFYTRGQVCERCKNGNYLHAVRFRCYKDSRLVTFVCAAALGINRLAGVLPKISGFICLTEFSKQKLMEIGVPERKLFVRPHSIDSTQIEPRFTTGDYLLFVGRLSEEKGVFTLIRAMEHLKDISLKIVGTGPMESELRDFVAEKGITNVSFAGAKTGQEKWELFRNSLLVIVPSEWYETFCLVAIEAYAAGKPVIASNIGSLPYVIEDGKTGLLFSPGSAEELRDKVRYLVQRPEEIQAMGRCGRGMVETKYHPNENYRALIHIFSKVSQHRGASPKGEGLLGVDQLHS